MTKNEAIELGIQELSNKAVDFEFSGEYQMSAALAELIKKYDEAIAILEGLKDKEAE